jgi:hypothetical protein
MKTQYEYWKEDHDRVMEEMSQAIERAASNTITCLAGSEEMLRIGPDGFWVRGVKVRQDDKEAEIVYNAFKEFLSWSQLTRR